VNRTVRQQAISSGGQWPAGRFRLLLALAALLLVGRLAHADTVFGSTANVNVTGYTNGLFFACTDDYPCFNETQVSHSASGSAASALATDTAKSSRLTAPAGISTSAFANVSLSSAHVALSFSADANGIGFGSGSGTASWFDLLTVSAPAGSDVVVNVNLGISAEFVGLGGVPGSVGSAEVMACWTAPVELCTSGADSTGGALTLPATVTAQLHLIGGQTYAIAGDASGFATVTSVDGASTSNTISWSMLATNSAHFSMEAVTPGVTLSLASGCSITSGYGCDLPPVPEPASPLLLLGGLAMLVVGTWVPVSAAHADIRVRDRSPDVASETSAVPVSA
jgi:hypothetical protein